MNAPLTNKNGLSLAMAVWLADDPYTDGSESHPGRTVISATSLLKPTRQIVLSNRLPAEDRVLDVSDLIPSRFGHAIHDSIEATWRRRYANSMARLGYPKKVIEQVRINPTDDEVADWTAQGIPFLPVYLEQRFFREILVDGHRFVISGQFDQIINGQLNDTKTTSTFSHTAGRRDEDYRLQGSIYRWINPDKVTNDIFLIQHVFTDWQSYRAKTDPAYPQSRVIERQLELLNERETEVWIRGKIREILANMNLPEPELIRCSDKDLWKSDPVFKYYADPKKAAEGGRSTKNFPNYPAAMLHRDKQGKGVVVEVPGKVKACSYCAGFPLCSQKDEYESDHERSQ